MFRQFLRLRLAVYPNDRLAAVLERRLVASTSDSDGSESKLKRAKQIERLDELWESMHDFNETVQKQRQRATQSAPLADEESQQPSQFARSTCSTRPEFTSTHETTGQQSSKESHHRPPLPPKPTDQELSDHLNSVLLNLRRPEEINRLLDSIKPVLPELEGHQMVIVYEALEKQDKNLQRDRAINVLRSKLRESSGFADLLNQTNLKIGEIDPNGLTIVFRFMRRVEQNPGSEIVRIVAEQIVKRLDEFNLEQVTQNLLVANLYSHEFPASGQLWRFRANLLENSRRRLLNDELEPDNFEQLENLFNNFLMNCQNVQAIDMLDHLTRKLLDNFELDFTRSVRLLGRITSSLRNEMEGKEAVEYPASIAELIEKCNSTVYDTLKGNPEVINNYYAYLEQVHRHPSRLYRVFPNFFDPRLLDLIGPLLAKDEAIGRGPKRLRRNRVLNLFFNYSNVHTFNEELTELICQLICNRAIENPSFSDYWMLSEYRFPSVDNKQLLNAFRISGKFLRSLKSRDRCYGLLCELILAESNDPGMLSYLNQNVDTRLDALIAVGRKSLLERYERTALARVVLSMFGQLEDKELETKLKHTLEERFNQLCTSGYRRHMATQYINADSRLQHPGFLSNGVVVDTFGIYDRSIGDLVPLEQFRSKFGEINSIPLTASQEL